MTKNGKKEDLSPSRRRESNPGAMRNESSEEPSIEDVVRQKLLEELLEKYSGRSVSLEEALSQEVSNTKTKKSVTEAGATGSSCSGVNLAEHGNKRTDGVNVPVVKSKKSPVSPSDSEDEEYPRRKVVVDKIAKSTKPQKKRPVKLSVSEDEAPASKKSIGDKVVVGPLKSSNPRKRSVAALGSDGEEHVSKRGTGDDQAISSRKSSKPRNRILPPAESEDDEDASKRFVVEDKVAQFVTPTKLRRKSAKDSGSEAEESARKRGAGEDQLLPTLSKSKRSEVKSSESEDEENCSKRSGLKDDNYNFPDLSSNNNTKSHLLTPIPKKQQTSKVGGPKQKSMTLSSQSKVGSDCYPESKRGKKSSSDAITGKLSLMKTAKNCPDESKHVKGKITPSTKPVPMTDKASADLLAKKMKSEKLNESPTKKSKKSLLMEHNSTKSLPERKETSPKVQSKLSAHEELLGSSIEKAKKLKEVGENPPPKFYATAADPQTKKSSIGKLAVSLKKKNQKKHGRDENVSEPHPEDHMHQLTRDESEKDEDLKPDELSDSPTFSVSCPQPPLVKTQMDLEHDNIAKIEEFHKSKSSPLKRKLSTLDPSPGKNYVVKGTKGDETLTIPEALDRDSLSMMECRVNIEILTVDQIATRCPNSVEQFKELKVGAEITSEEKLSVTTGTSNIVKEDVFLKPSHLSIVSSKSKIPSRSPALNVKSSNATKRTSKPQKLFKPTESRAQRNPIKVSARDVPAAPPDPFADWHKPKKNLHPLEKLRNEENELDYELDNDNDDDVMSIMADTAMFQNMEEAHVSEETLVQRLSHNGDEDCGASCGSDDSRRLSDVDMDVDSDHSEAQDEPNDSNKLDQIISAPQKENVLGIPVEDYSASKIDQHKRDSVESGELVDDDDSNSLPEPDQTGNAENVTCEKHNSPSFLKKVSGTLQYNNKDSTTDSLNLPKQKNAKECIQNRLCEGDDADQKSSTDSNQSTNHSELLQLTSARGSTVLQPDQRVDRNIAGLECKIIPAKRRSRSEAIKTYPSVPAKNNPEVSTVTAVLSYSDDNSELSIMPFQDGCRSKLISAGARKSFETQRVIASSTSSQSTTTIPNKLQPVDIDVEGDSWMSKMDIPIPAGVRFDTPRRGLLATPKAPSVPSMALLKTPDHEPHNAVPSTSSAMPIEKAPQLPARKAPTEGPTPLSHKVPQDQKASNVLQTFRNNASTIGSQRSIPVSSTNLKSPLGIEPIQQQSHHYVHSFKDTDFRQRDVDHRFNLHQGDDDQRSNLHQQGADYRYNSRQQDADYRYNSRQQDADFRSNSRQRKVDERSDLRTNDNEERSLKDPVAADLLDDALMLYCTQYLTAGECSNVENCNKLHQFPELVLDETQKHDLSVRLICKMLLCFPFWRENKFLSSVETLGSYNHELLLSFVARSYWNHCCECNLEKTEVDYNYWNQLAQALSKCGFKPAVCARKLLRTVLYYKKKPLSRQLYHVIDNIVDKLFPDFIEGCSDLWFGLSVLAKLEYYEIPANLMREILRDTLTDSRNSTEHGEICDYLLKGSTIPEPRKPEDWEFLHFIHQFLFVLQRCPRNLPRALNLAVHFNICVKNPCPCCVQYATKIEASEVVEVPRLRFTLSRPLSPIISSRSDEYLNNYQPKTLQPGVDDGLAQLALHPTSHVLSNDLLNVENTRSSQGTFAAQSTSSNLLNSTNEGEVTSSTEVNSPTLLTTNDNETMCTEEISGNMIETTTTSNLRSQARNKYSGLVIVAEGDKRCVKSKASEPEPPHQNSHVPVNALNIGNIEVNPPVSKVLQSTKEELEGSARHPVADLIKAGKCGKAAKFISTWKNIHKDKRGRGINVIVTTLMEMDSGTRIKTFQSLLQAIAAHMSGTGTADNQLKAIMVPIGLSVLENFLRENHNLEAKEVHNVLWAKMSPLSVQLESHSPSYLELITAWVYVKNNMVKEALDIMTSNNFSDICEKWAIRANPSDKDLRDQVCSVILNHCEELDSYAVHAEKLFRNMLSAKESYNIDVTQFFDDILRALVKASHVPEALSLLVWAHTTHDIKPLRSSTYRLLLTHTSAQPNSVNFSREMIYILNQEPYDQALPQSVEGLSRVNVCLQSVWSIIEVHAIIFGFLLNGHLCNLNQDIPDIAVEIKECPLPTPAPGEKLFPSDLLNINPSVPAMEERVLSVVQPLLNPNNSRFENGSLELDRQAVGAYVTGRQRNIDSTRRPRPRSSDRPINTGRKRGDMHFHQNRPPPNYRWGPANQWQSHNQPSSSQGHHPNYHNFSEDPVPGYSSDAFYPNNGYDTYCNYPGYQQGNWGYQRNSYNQNHN